MSNLKYIVLLCFISFTVETVRKPAPAPRRGIHPEIQQYVDRFVSIGKKFKGESFVLKWINMDIGEVKDPWDIDHNINDDVVGWCKPYFVPMEIMLQTQEWRLANDLEREQLVFHELGHCQFGFPHDESIKDGRPVSIMYPYLLSRVTYKEHRDEYLKELFTKKAP